MVFNSNWAKNDKKSKDNYYFTFSSQNWIKLSKSEKDKHELFCDQCLKMHCVISSTFPSKAIAHDSAKKENPIHLVKAMKKQIRKEKSSLNGALEKISEELNPAFIKCFGKSFDNSYQNKNKLEKFDRKDRRQPF